MEIGKLTKKLDSIPKNVKANHFNLMNTFTNVDKFGNIFLYMTKLCQNIYLSKTYDTVYAICVHVKNF